MIWIKSRRKGPATGDDASRIGYDAACVVRDYAGACDPHLEPRDGLISRDCDVVS